MGEPNVLIMEAAPPADDESLDSQLFAESAKIAEFQAAAKAAEADVKAFEAASEIAKGEWDKACNDARFVLVEARLARDDFTEAQQKILSGENNPVEFETLSEKNLAAGMRYYVALEETKLRLFLFTAAKRALKARVKERDEIVEAIAAAEIVQRALLSDWKTSLEQGAPPPAKKTRSE